ncbi:hypothetical protein [Paludisphaera soli]|uniref:hypothetical protein n=1 Tax=Paludisphaera soli TaxID=2712865 RepID=UPI0013ECD0F9|nr:hypothetical protein [Paludisphaera soli]
MMSTTMPVSARISNFSTRATRLDAATAARPFGPTEDLSGLSSFHLADRLAQVWTRNARRLEGLDDLRDRIDAARRHLATSTAGRKLGEVYLRRLLEKQDACRAALRADRRAALALVRECEARSRNAESPSLLRRAVVVLTALPPLTSRIKPSSPRTARSCPPGKVDRPPHAQLEPATG